MAKVSLKEARAACRRDLLYFAKAAMPTIFNLRSPAFHRVLADEIMGPNPQVNVIAPRGFAKTTVVMIAGALWHIFCSPRPKGKPRFVLLVSKSRPHAINILTTIKNILEFSKAFRALFGYHGSQTAQTWREDFVVLGNGDILVCRGMRTQVRGLNVNGIRPTFIGLDDGEDEENTKTADRMEANFGWFLQALVPCGTPNDCKIFNIGTPQHQSCIVYRLEEMDNWVTHRFQAVVRDEDGREESLWPELRSLEWLNAKKASLDAIGRVSFFYREYMCEVIGDSDQMFRPEYFEHKWTGKVVIDDDRRHYIEIPGMENRVPVHLFMGIDPASTLSATADYTAIVVIAVDRNGVRYIVDVLRKRMKPLAVADAIIDMYKKYKPVKSQIETVGFQAMIGDHIRDRGHYIPGLSIKNNPRMRKQDRLQALQPLLATGKLRVPTREQLPVISDVIDEFLMYPRGRNDDTIDAFFYANKGAYRPYHDAVRADGKVKSYLKRKKLDWKVI